jgi:hypothetical protein
MGALQSWLLVRGPTCPGVLSLLMGSAVVALGIHIFRTDWQGMSVHDKYSRHTSVSDSWHLCLIVGENDSGSKGVCVEGPFPIGYRPSSGNHILAIAAFRTKLA